MMTGQVSYSLAAFKRARFVNRGGQVLLEAAEADAASALVAYAAAVEECNEYMVELEDRDTWGQVNAPVVTPDGPMALVTECEPAKALALMLDRLRGGLEARGITGTLRPGRTACHPVFANTEFPCLGTWLFLPADEGEVLRTYDATNRGPLKEAWAVPPEATRAVVGPVVEWVLEIGGAIYVTVGATRFQLDADAVEDFVVSTLPIDYLVSVQRVPADDRCRRVAFLPSGAAIVQTFDPALERSEVLTQLTDLSRSVAPHTRGSFMREMGTWTNHRDLLRASHPPAPVLNAVTTGYWMLAHLEGDYVYDAFLAQVLTGSQLQKTTALPSERWTVTDLGGDRYEVRHKNPELWFDRDPTPFEDRTAPTIRVADEVLAQARADFGDAIMTGRTVEEHPPPLPREEQVRALALYGLTPH